MIGPIPQDALEFAQGFVSYNQETGEFRYLRNVGRCRVGHPAGYTRTDGYLVFNCQGKIIRGNRLAWVLSGRTLTPGMDIDHINGNPGDNRLSNLRMVSRGENLRNRKGPDRDSVSGILGVSPCAGGRWLAQLQIEGKNKNLGRYSTRDEAQAVHDQAKAKHHPTWHRKSE